MTAATDPPVVHSEAAILEAVLAVLLPYCVWIARVNGGRFMMKGRGQNRIFVAYRLYRPPLAVDNKTIRLPDLIGQLPDGRVLAVEVKKPGGTITDAQAAFLDLVRRTGGVADICYDADDARWLVRSVDASLHKG